MDFNSKKMRGLIELTLISRVKIDPKAKSRTIKILKTKKLEKQISNVGNHKRWKFRKKNLVNLQSIEYKSKLRKRPIHDFLIIILLKKDKV